MSSPFSHTGSRSPIRGISVQPSGAAAFSPSPQRMHFYGGPADAAPAVRPSPLRQSPLVSPDRNHQHHSGAAAYLNNNNSSNKVDSNNQPGAFVRDDSRRSASPFLNYNGANYGAGVGGAVSPLRSPSQQHSPNAAPPKLNALPPRTPSPLLGRDNLPRTKHWVGPYITVVKQIGKGSFGEAYLATVDYTGGVPRSSSPLSMVGAAVARGDGAPPRSASPSSAGTASAAAAVAASPVSHFPPTIVIKVTPDQRNFRYALKEIELLRKIRHPHICQYVDSWRESGGRSALEGKMCFAMEYCDSGDLEKFIDTYKHRYCRPIPPEVVSVLALQLISAVASCHANKIVHRDIKPQNIFLTRRAVGGGGDGGGGDVQQKRRTVVALGDFGISKDLSYTMEPSNSVVGTPYYMCPEIVTKQPYTNTSDVWSVGVVLYEMMMLERPFELSRNVDRRYQMGLLYDDICRTDPLRALRQRCGGGGVGGMGGEADSADAPPKYDEWLISLTEACLRKDPKERPSAMDLLTRFSPAIDQLLVRHRIPVPRPPSAAVPSSGLSAAAAAAVAGVASSPSSAASVAASALVGGAVGGALSRSPVRLRAAPPSPIPASAPAPITDAAGPERTPTRQRERGGAALAASDFADRPSSHLSPSPQRERERTVSPSLNGPSAAAALSPSRRSPSAAAVVEDARSASAAPQRTPSSLAASPTSVAASPLRTPTQQRERPPQQQSPSPQREPLSGGGGGNGGAAFAAPSSSLGAHNPNPFVNRLPVNIDVVRASPVRRAPPSPQSANSLRLGSPQALPRAASPSTNQFGAGGVGVGVVVGVEVKKGEGSAVVIAAKDLLEELRQKRAAREASSNAASPPCQSPSAASPPQQRAASVERERALEAMREEAAARRKAEREAFEKKRQQSDREAAARAEAEAEAKAAERERRQGRAVAAAAAAAAPKAADAAMPPLPTTKRGVVLEPLCAREGDAAVEGGVVTRTPVLLPRTPPRSPSPPSINAVPQRHSPLLLPNINAAAAAAAGGIGGSTSPAHPHGQATTPPSPLSAAGGGRAAPAVMPAARALSPPAPLPSSAAAVAAVAEPWVVGGYPTTSSSPSSPSTAAVAVNIREANGGERGEVATAGIAVISPPPQHKRTATASPADAAAAAHSLTLTSTDNADSQTSMPSAPAPSAADGAATVVADFHISNAALDIARVMDRHRGAFVAAAASASRAKSPPLSAEGLLLQRQQKQKGAAAYDGRKVAVAAADTFLSAMSSSAATSFSAALDTRHGGAIAAAAAGLSAVVHHPHSNANTSASSASASLSYTSPLASANESLLLTGLGGDAEAFLIVKLLSLTTPMVVSATSSVSSASPASLSTLSGAAGSISMPVEEEDGSDSDSDSNNADGDDGDTVEMKKRADCSSILGFGFAKRRIAAVLEAIARVDAEVEAEVRAAAAAGAWEGGRIVGADGTASAEADPFSKSSSNGHGVVLIDSSANSSETPNNNSNNAAGGGQQKEGRRAAVGAQRHADPYFASAIRGREGKKRSARNDINSNSAPRRPIPPTVAPNAPFGFTVGGDGGAPTTATPRMALVMTAVDKFFGEMSATSAATHYLPGGGGGGAGTISPSASFAAYVAVNENDRLPLRTANANRSKG